jgi:hypothetical protein
LRVEQHGECGSQSGHESDTKDGSTHAAL